MIPNEWSAYSDKNTDAILTEILTEEIRYLDQRRGKTGSRKSARIQLIYIVELAAILLLWGFLPLNWKPAALPIIIASLPFLFNATLFRGGGCVVLMLGWPVCAGLYLILRSIPGFAVTLCGVIICTTLYLLTINKERNSGRMRLLMAEAKANPDKDLAQIVADQSYVVDEERHWADSKVLIVVIVALALVGCGFGIATNYSDIITTDASVEWSNREPQAVYTWEKTDAGYMLVDFDAGTQEVNPTIPAKIDGIPVVAIRERAFQNERRVTAVVLPESVVEVGSYAFKGCTALESVTMGDQVSHIGGEAFLGCSSLTSFVIPAGVTEIRGNTFQDCTSLTQVQMHENITAIHAFAFQGCSSLNHVFLPAGITEIRANTFENCVSLTSIIIPEGVTRIAAHAFRGCSSLAEAEIPTTVQEIGSSAFRECTALKEVSLPASCQVDERAFKDSPTRLLTQPFTTEQVQAIHEELFAMELEQVYFLYHKDLGKDKVCFPEEDGHIYFASSPSFTEFMDESLALELLDGDAEILAYLYKAKEQGTKVVECAVLSEVASEIQGTNWFVSMLYDIDELITSLENDLAES